MGKGKAAATVIAGVLIVAVMIAMIGVMENNGSAKDRLSAIPTTAVKMTPDSDPFRPVVHSDEWSDPVPMSGPFNTAGAEDSPFITPNGTWFFFFFTPDVSVPVEKQLIDGVTGIWWSQKIDGAWTEPEKIILHDDVSLDGAEFVQGDTMWFASVRAGNYGEIDVYTAKYDDGEWGSVENAGTQLNVDYDIGEFHITSDGQTMFFHTGNLSAGGNMDLWTTSRTMSGWSTPEKVPGLSTDRMEGYPFLTEDGSELWFTGWSTLGYQGPAIFRCLKVGDAWSEPVEILSNFAGECTIDSAGNIYFVHHYFDENMTMIEADIYVAYSQDTRSTYVQHHSSGVDSASALVTFIVAATSHRLRYSEHELSMNRKE